MRMSTPETNANLSATFEPHLDILPPAQLRLWPELSDTPDEFSLGTAMALRLGHPTSVDFDFFANNPFTPKTSVCKSPLPQRGRGAALGAEYADRDG